MAQSPSAEAAVLYAAIEHDYDEVARLLYVRETWSRDGIWHFKKTCEELVSFLSNVVIDMEEEPPHE
jgi:hypothetical protein